jgi:membrane-bound lytic murein transglycosylase D
VFESGLNPKAYSYAHASGVWQFIASTGKMYGLKKNWWIDERRDFEKSTRAAAHYLKDLYEEFGDWYLAFAAYNCGSSRVKKEMKRHQSDDYWKLKRLPSQTRNYVPNIMAAIYISNNPQKYGFYVAEEENMKWRLVNIDKTVSLEILSECSKLDIANLQIYNPELKQGTLPPLKEGETYPFRLPLQASLDFDSLLAEVAVEFIEEIVFLDHKVKRGESLWLIARKYNFFNKLNCYFSQ